MTRPVGIHIPYMVWIIKINIFPIFTQKSEKLHYDFMATSKSYRPTPAPLKIRARCLLQAGGLRGRAIERCPSNLPLTDPCCHGNKPPLFEHKIGNNSACMGHMNMTPISAPIRGYQGRQI